MVGEYPTEAIRAKELVKELGQGWKRYRTSRHR